ncbi:MAG: hypothetical protein HYY93_01170 [Planctomycetes bacterium]|nr:hypothetical protein [Planctomycetota bacterium]
MGRWASLREKWAHAFAISGPGEALTAEDEVLLARIAKGIAERRMTLPALFTLESLTPVQFVGSQGMLALRPLLELGVPAADLELASRICERRGAIPRLCALLEEVDGRKAP